MATLAEIHEIHALPFDILGVQMVVLDGGTSVLEVDGAVDQTLFYSIFLTEDELDALSTGEGLPPQIKVRLVPVL